MWLKFFQRQVPSFDEILRVVHNTLNQLCSTQVNFYDSCGFSLVGADVRDAEFLLIPTCGSVVLKQEFLDVIPLIGRLFRRPGNVIDQRRLVLRLDALIGDRHLKNDIGVDQVFDDSELLADCENCHVRLAEG